MKITLSAPEPPDDGYPPMLVLVKEDENGIIQNVTVLVRINNDSNEAKYLGGRVHSNSSKHQIWTSDPTTLAKVVQAAKREGWRIITSSDSPIPIKLWPLPPHLQP